MGQVAITLECHVREDALMEAESILSDLAAVCSADEGTLFYVVGRSQTEPTVFRILELYASAEAVEIHRANPRVREAVNRLRPLLAGPLVGNLHDVVADGH